MSGQPIDAALKAYLQEKVIDDLSDEDLITFHHDHYCTIPEAVKLCEEAGVKLRKNTNQQFYLLCDRGRLQSFFAGDRALRLILKRSLMTWIEQMKQKQGAKGW